MRTASGVLFGAALFLSVPSPGNAECQTICHRECWRTPQGQCVCGNRCIRRCWAPPPEVYRPAPQQYAVPHYAPPRYVEPRFSGPSPDDLIALGILGGLAVLLIAGLASALSAATDSSKEIAEIEAETAERQKLISKLEADAREVDRHLAAALKNIQPPGDHHG